MSTTPLVDIISKTLKQASTTSFDVSFNELLDMYEQKELNISPSYQRLFRWTEGQRSRFIETLLLEMPVPPIFVIEEQEGRYQLIDGLQRISSYLHLRGKLDAPHLEPPVAPGQFLKLSDCDIVKELNGVSFDDLPSSLQIRLKRAFIRVEVIRKDTNAHFKYHMFKRLNTGGDRLSDQQVRNCTIRMLGEHFPDFLIRMSEMESFVDCTQALTQERKLSAFDEELVLRYFALKNDRQNFKHSVSDFLTEYMEAVSDPQSNKIFDYVAEEQIFVKTFNILSKALGEESFAFANRSKTKLSAGFSIYHFEAITIGLQSVIDKINAEDQHQIDLVSHTLRTVKLSNEFIDLTSGGGKNSPGPLSDRIGRIEGALKSAFP